MEIIGIAILFYIGFLIAPFVIMAVLAISVIIAEVLGSIFGGSKNGK